MKIIDVKHLTKTFGSRFNQNKVLDNLSFTVDEGEFVGVMGPSGAGKSTLLNILSSIELPSFGSIEIAGKDMTRLKDNQLSDFRRKELGFIFQEFNLLDTLNAHDNIMLPLAIDDLPKAEIESRIQQAADLLGISELLQGYPEELSVGQRQRVAAARALVVQPKIIFADEPTGALDSKAATELLRYLQEVNQQAGTTILMVTHDPYTASYCDRILFIKDGVFFSEIVKTGTREDFFQRVIDMQATIGGGGRRNVR